MRLYHQTIGDCLHRRSDNMNMTKERKGKEERKNKIVAFSDREVGAILVLIFLRQEWPKVIQYPMYSSTVYKYLSVLKPLVRSAKKSKCDQLESKSGMKSEGDGW